MRRERVRRLALVPAAAAVLVVARRLAARSNTQVHRINQGSTKKK
jgi:hypothetical protein